MTSINTNVAATVALRTLQQTGTDLASTQQQIATGYKINSAKDNAAYWSISTTLKSDNKSLGTVKDALGLGAATVDVAYQGLTKAKDVLDEIKAKLTSATQAGVDRTAVQADITALQEQLKSIATSSNFSGENWLQINSAISGYDSTKTVVSSFARDANNSVSIGTIDIDTTTTALFDTNTTGSGGIVDATNSLKAADGTALTYGGNAVAGNTSVGGLAATTATGTAATSAKSTFTGAFTATTLDSNDILTLGFTVDGSAASITIQAADITTAKGFATAGTISSVDELVKAVNNKFADNGISTAAAVNNGGAFALQNASTGYNHTVAVTTFTGTDATFVASGITTAAAAGTAGLAYTAEKQTATVTTAASGAGDVLVTLATGESVNLTGAITTAAATTNTVTASAAAIVAAINADSTLSPLVTASNVAGAITLTYKSSGDKANFTIASGTSAPTALVIGAVTQTTAYASNAASDTLTYTSGSSAAFGDDDDALLFQFTDSAVGGGSTQTVHIKKVDLVTAGNTSLVISDGVTLAAALSAALTRESASNSTLAGYTVSGVTGSITLSKTGEGVAGEVIAITSPTTAFTAIDPTPALSTTFGLTKTTGTQRGTDATSAATATTLALPTGGIVLDSDDAISFGVKVGANDVKTATINQALVNTVLASATTAKATAGVFDVTSLASGDAISFTVDWDGVASSYKITGLTSTSTASDFVTAINAATVTAGAGTVGTTTFASKGTASVVDGKIVFSALTSGAAHSVAVRQVSNTNSTAGSGGLQNVAQTFGEDAVASPGGTISTAAQYARVVDAAISAAGVTGVAAKNTSGVLSLTTTATGATASVVLSDVAASSGANTIAVKDIDLTSTAFTSLTDKQKAASLSAYISVVNDAITKVTSAAASLGSVSSRIDLQTNFVTTLIDTIDKGVGQLIDADVSEESTKLQALQVKQQLGVQALSIANTSSQQILRLFQ